MISLPQRRILPGLVDLSSKLILDQIPPAGKMTGSRVPPTCRCRGRDGRGHGFHEENSGVWPPSGLPVQFLTGQARPRL